MSKAGRLGPLYEGLRRVVAASPGSRTAIEESMGLGEEQLDEMLAGQAGLDVASMLDLLELAATPRNTTATRFS